MKLIVAALFSALLTMASAAAEPVEKRNPALVYWQATARLPNIGNKESRLISDVLSGKSSAEELASLLDQSDIALQLFRRATYAKAPCDWGLLLEDGPLAPLPHTSKMQIMARLALCQARLLFERRETIEALHWIIAD